MKDNRRTSVRVSRNRLAQYVVLAVFVAFSAMLLHGESTAAGIARDPGPQGGPPNAGGPLPGLSSEEINFFQASRFVFQEFDSVTGSLNDNPFPAVFNGPAGGGLGPGFNENSCAICHAQPAVGGSSPGENSKQIQGPGVIGPIANPQIAVATLDGAANKLPSFITAAGPVREARFILDPQTGQTDGGVHDLYTIQGRTDAPGCVLAQPNFNVAIDGFAGIDVINRIPTPTFGLGLVENTPDLTLEANLAADQAAAQKADLNIVGKFNTSGNDGTITRFGWKAQNKSLLMFAGEAYNVEVGVSNEVFPNERNAVAGCVFNTTPEDLTNGIAPSTPLSTTVPANVTAEVNSDITNFAGFMRLLAPPTSLSQGPGGAAAVAAGKALFSQIGCNLCHSPTLTTAASPFTNQSNVTYHPYSDFAVHHMGSTLADGVTQGGAGPDEFRTAPLWGLSQRLFFLHDGRTSDLMQAIQDHASSNRDCVSSETTEQFEIVFQVSGTDVTINPKPAEDTFCGSEANKVIGAFNELDNQQKQELLDFLRSL
ncbi:MAG TPA: di-heme oxidoredictase family protein [Blastocatellia bacterium]